MDDNSIQILISLVPAVIAFSGLLSIAKGVTYQRFSSSFLPGQTYPVGGLWAKAIGVAFVVVGVVLYFWVVYSSPPLFGNYIITHIFCSVIGFLLAWGILKLQPILGGK